MSESKGVADELAQSDGDGSNSVDEGNRGRDLWSAGRVFTAPTLQRHQPEASKSSDEVDKGRKNQVPVLPDFKDQVRTARRPPEEQQDRIPRFVSAHPHPESHDPSSHEDEIEPSSGGLEGVVVPNAVLVESRGEVPLASLVPVHLYKTIFVLLMIAVSAVVFVGVFCGTGNCSMEPGNDQDATLPPSNNQSEIDDIKSYINNITLSGSAMEYTCILLMNCPLQTTTWRFNGSWKKIRFH